MPNDPVHPLLHRVDNAPDSAIAQGLFDFQVNGFAGVDFQSDNLTAAGLRHAVDALRRDGVTGIFATLITDAVDRLCQRLRNFELLRQQDPVVASCILGYHLEGPWLSPEPGYCGAHPPQHMHAPRWSEFERLQDSAGGNVRLVTLAPEWDGSADCIARLCASGVHVALGHAAAGDADIDAAIGAGARFCTHVGNGVPGMLPRHDNVVQRLLARDELTACFIPDGIHLPPFVLKNFVRAKPSGRVLFTTDAMAGAGAPPGTYTLGALCVEVHEDCIARMPGGHGFAGSTLTPGEGVRRVSRFLGIDAAEATRWWSSTPALAFGVAGQLMPA